MLQEQEVHAAEVTFFVFFILKNLTSIYISFHHHNYLYFCYFLQLERTFIAIKPDGVQRGLVCTLYSNYNLFCLLFSSKYTYWHWTVCMWRYVIIFLFQSVITKRYYFNLQIAEIISRFERKGYKLVAIKLIVPSKEFAEKHYHDLKERPFFNGLCDFLSSGPVLAMVCWWIV